MSDLNFSHCNIAMATHETTGRIIVWDRDTDTFGSGFDYPEALTDLASNYNEEYKHDEDSVTYTDSVPNDDLWRKIQQWHKAADHFDGEDEREQIKASTVRKAARELEELIDGE